MDIPTQALINVHLEAVAKGVYLPPEALDGKLPITQHKRESLDTALLQSCS